LHIHREVVGHDSDPRETFGYRIAKEIGVLRMPKETHLHDLPIRTRMEALLKSITQL
jgi:hypothetical protein